MTETHLSNATKFNTRFAHAYSWLGEIRSRLGTGDPVGLVMRGVTLEPYEVDHRARGAVVFLRARKLNEAEVQAKNALALAETEEDRRMAQRILDDVTKAKAAAAPAEGG